MRKTKIICTIGPASESEEMLRKLIAAGMNVARFNFSHGTHEEHEAKFRRVVRLRRELGVPVATLLDTKGPEIRLRDFEEGKVVLEKGQTFTLTTEEVMGNSERASVTYKDLPMDVSVGGMILIDDGLIGLRVDSKTDTEVVCTVINGGPVSNHKGVNLPGADLSMPFISKQDRSDIEFGCRMGYDFIAASFTRTAKDVNEIREILNANNSRMKIIAKIESVQGVNNIEEILEAADGVMVARGDLGVEVPLEEVPVIQKHIIKRAVQLGKIVVTATQMLDSMMKNPRPTRAEATDVANAIYDGTTAIMLSGETAAGSYPEEAVMTMSTIAERAEQDIHYRQRMKLLDDDKTDITTAISHATCTVAEDIGAKAIITVTISGFTANRLSRYKPTCPIIACTISESVACQMNVLFDVFPLNIPQEDREEMLFDAAVDAAKKAGYVEKGDNIVLTAGVPLGVAGNTNMTRVILMGKSGTGKDTIYRELLSDGALPFERLVPCTTRPIRAGEQNGREYHFYSVEEFRALERAGKVIESRCYETVHGPWYYFTADDGQIDLASRSTLMIGTLESYLALRAYYGADKVLPVYLEVEDGERLQRALDRERAEKAPKYRELCRRFLADCEDFSEEKIAEAGITRRFQNDDLQRCKREIEEYLAEMM